MILLPPPIAVIGAAAIQPASTIPPRGLSVAEDRLGVLRTLPLYARAALCAPQTLIQMHETETLEYRNSEKDILRPGIRVLVRLADGENAPVDCERGRITGEDKALVYRDLLGSIAGSGFALSIASGSCGFGNSEKNRRKLALGVSDRRQIWYYLLVMRVAKQFTRVLNVDYRDIVFGRSVGSALVEASKAQFVDGDVNEGSE